MIDKRFALDAMSNIDPFAEQVWSKIEMQEGFAIELDPSPCVQCVNEWQGYYLTCLGLGSGLLRYSTGTCMHGINSETFIAGVSFTNFFTRPLNKFIIPADNQCKPTIYEKSGASTVGMAIRYSIRLRHGS